MTQEELDALMGEDIELDEVSDDEIREEDTTENEQLTDVEEKKITR
jgi:hypothetical protein